MNPQTVLGQSDYNDLCECGRPLREKPQECKSEVHQMVYQNYLAGGRRRGKRFRDLKRAEAPISNAQKHSGILGHLVNGAFVTVSHADTIVRGAFAISSHLCMVRLAKRLLAFVLRTKMCVGVIIYA